MDPRSGRLSAGLAAIVLAVAAGFAGWQWWYFSEMMRQSREGEMTIALGLPIVTVAGAVGGVLALAAVCQAALADRAAR